MFHGGTVGVSDSLEVKNLVMLKMDLTRFSLKMQVLNFNLILRKLFG